MRRDQPGRTRCSARSGRSARRHRQSRRWRHQRLWPSCPRRRYTAPPAPPASSRHALPTVSPRRSRIGPYRDYCLRLSSSARHTIDIPPKLISMVEKMTTEPGPSEPAETLEIRGLETLKVMADVRRMEIVDLLRGR